MKQNVTAKPAKPANNFICNYCDYITSRKYNFNEHLLTPKHIKMTNVTINETNVTAKPVKPATPILCDCGKNCNNRTSLWRHKKNCNYIVKENIIENITDKDLIMMLVKQNSELLEVIKNGTHNTTNTNSNNKAFNLNFFLNETCKDAMNIMDFVDSIKLQLSDLERVGEMGYVEGISNIIVKNLKELDVSQRPVHCTDKKRETLYIKDENKWEKDENKQTMHKLVKRVASKNARLLPKFKEAHPDCCKSVSKFSDQYNKIIVESMGGSGDNDYEKEEKIIAKISKEIVVEK